MLVLILKLIRGNLLQSVHEDDIVGYETPTLIGPLTGDCEEYAILKSSPQINPQGKNKTLTN